MGFGGGMETNNTYRLTEEARDFFAPNYAADFFRIVDVRAKGRRTIRAVALLANGSEMWRDARTFEVQANELEVIK